LDSSYLVNNFRVRFNLSADNTISYPGYYVDDLVVSIYTAEQPTLPCDAPSGGLVVGNVYDANTGNGLNGAVVMGDASNSAMSQATPLDTAVDDGFYTLYSPAGSHDVTASKAQYADDMQTVNVVAATAVSQNFTLGAGLLAADPTSLSATLDMGDSTTLNLDLDNNGGLSADFKLREADQGMAPALLATGAALQRIPGQFSPAWHNESVIGNQLPVISRITDLPWVDITSLPTALMDHAAAEYNGRIYVVGGFDGFSVTGDGYVYDPDTTSWASIASMNNARQKPSAAFIGDLLYVVGGWDFNGNPVAALEIYDPASDSWSTGANMPVPVAGAPAVVLDGQMYVIGGCLDGFCTPTNNVYRYDVDANSWESTAAYPEQTAWQSCGVIEGQIYCAGGAGFDESNHTYGYDPGSDTWTQLADMVQTQWGSAFVAVNGRLYISAGVTAGFSVVTNQTFIYDPAADTWTADANANYAVYRTASACGFYKLGGSSGGFGPVADSELYPDLTDCGATSDVPWLSMTPITGTIGTGSSQTIQVMLDAGVPEVTQPGDYRAQIRVSDNTPYKMEPITVTMTVNAPASWGKVAGTVTGLARCDAPGAPLNKATVDIGTTASVKTGSNGGFLYWLPNGS
jgi:N-acetylneuraminic acid mutarotase